MTNMSRLDRGRIIRIFNLSNPPKAHYESIFAQVWVEGVGVYTLV